MIRKKRYLAAKMGLLALGLMLLFPGQAEAADKKTIYNSPYVSFSPDGKAFTTCAGDQNYTWYAEDDSTTVYTGIKSSLRSLRTGEHYYKVARWGEVPVGSWKVVHRPGQCIHDGYTSDENWHGIQFGTQKCMQYYYSGWKAFCADCGEPLEDSNIYMSREAASSIQYLDLGSEKNPVFYYYLCPFCRNLEQGVGLSAHWCKEISWNQYRVVYKANSGVDGYNGYMDYSYHMYNNETIYEGETVTPVTHLTENNYTRVGYVFTGWNTKQDGSGVSFTDKEEIYNLSSSDWNDQSTWTDTDRGTITLYAQWRKSESTLVIDANGGKYGGLDKQSITQLYLKKYVLQADFIQAPEGYQVSFETNGGSTVETILGTKHFVEWMREQPFKGWLDDNKYIFTAPDGNVDTVKAAYHSDPITLPVTTKDGWSFGGWYYDSDFSLPAGGAGDQIIPSKDMTLYAQWVDLRLQAVDNYEVNDGKGAVDLSWSQSDQNNKTYLVYQKKEDGAWIRVNSANDISSTTVIDQTYTFDGQAKSWYVRADGSTPFTLKNEAYMDGTASRGYQLNETIYETVSDDSSVARNIIRTASTEIADTSIRTDANGLSYSTDGTTALQQYSYSYTVRSNKNRDLMGVQKFTISRDLSGQTIQVIPVAEADKESDKVYSAHELDEKNKITLIADGEAPVIRGLEIMEDRDLIDRRDGSITVTVTADDDLSGVKDFYVVIKNTDNAITKTYLPDVDGSIRITITEDEPIFSGDFTVLGYAVDNVGNENNLSYGTTEFALASSVERILSPHDPIFKCGESGILTFTTWGYADRVEVIFPESMTALDPTLNKVYDYTDCPGYMITEHLQFMVPLYTPENQNLEITVRAYKGDKKLEDHPTISVIGVSGTVLDEFRTRLR